MHRSSLIADSTKKQPYKTQVNMPIGQHNPIATSELCNIIGCHTRLETPSKYSTLNYLVSIIHAGNWQKQACRLNRLLRFPHPYQGPVSDESLTNKCMLHNHFAKSFFKAPPMTFSSGDAQNEFQLCAIILLTSAF